MNKIIKSICFIATLIASNLSHAALIGFNDRAVFEDYVNSFTVDDLNVVSGTPSTDLSNADYSWTISDYACIDSTGCIGIGVNPLVNGTNDWVWTYGDGNFNFDSGITAFGLDYSEPSFTIESQVSLNGMNSGMNPNGSFFGIASDDGSFIGPILYKKFSEYGGFDNVTYSTSVNGGPGVSTVPVPAAAWLFGSALLGFFGFSRKKATVA